MLQRWPRALFFLVPVLLFAILQAAQTHEPRRASEFPATHTAATFLLGAEYSFRTVMQGADSFDTPGYLVVEVALEPLKERQPFRVGKDRFSLRINGKKPELVPQSPYMVAAAIKYPDWNRQKGLQAGAGMGDATVILGRPPIEPRFPGDNRPAQRRGPSVGQVPPQQAPETMQSPQQKGDSPDELAVKLALEDGEFQGPIRGFLYFAYEKNLKSIKQVELLYREGPSTEPWSLKLK
jgi:hypothetical protein